MNFRIGHGYDIHRLQPGGKLMLGGVVVSDQTSVPSRTATAMSSSTRSSMRCSARWAGATSASISPHRSAVERRASRVFLENGVHLRAKSRLTRWSNVDVTILAERPKLKPFKPQMVHVAEPTARRATAR